MPGIFLGVKFQAHVFFWVRGKPYDGVASHPWGRGCATETGKSYSLIGHVALRLKYPKASHLQTGPLRLKPIKLNVIILTKIITSQIYVLCTSKDLCLVKDFPLLP